MTAWYSRHPDLRLTAIDGEGVVLHLGSRRYFSVNETGVTILEALTAPRTLDDLIASVTTEYDVTAVAAEQSVREFIDRCREAQLQPLTASDVSVLLDELCHDLAPYLAHLELNPPCLTSEHHDVGAPLSWRNKSEWLVDKIPAPVKKDRTVMTGVRQRRDALSRLDRS